MKARVWFAGCAALLVAACGEMQGTGDSAAAGFMAKVPDGVLEIAAPNQDMTRVRIDPVDGCYVYRYVGPVETTMLPVRSREGRPICSRPAETPANG